MTQIVQSSNQPSAFISGAYYHLFNHANGEELLFQEPRNYPFFLSKYHEHPDSVAETPVWCLMPNHFHLLVKIKSEEDIKLTHPKFGTFDEFGQSNFISRRFAHFFSSYTQACNKVYDPRGFLFIKNFKRKQISNEAYLATLVLYVHLNPVKHSFCSAPESWEWSSVHEFRNRERSFAEKIFGSYEQYGRLLKEKADRFLEYVEIELELT